MKKLFLGAALGISAMSFAQIDFSSTRYGVIAGLDYSRVKNAHNPSGPRFGPQIGVTALIPIDKTNQLYIQPEVVYYAAGESGKNKDAKGKTGYDAVYANNYISVPLYFKGYFSEAESEFFGLAGPRFSFLVNQKVSNPAKLAYTIDGDPAHPGVNGKAASFDFAIGLGVGYSYKRKIEASVRYDLGVSNAYPDMVESWTQDPNTAKKKSQQVLSFTLNYIFD